MTSAFAQLSDEALLAQIALGDEPALAELYDRFGRIAYGLAVQVLRDQALAEDAVQDAFLGAWRTAAAFDPTRGNGLDVAADARPPPRRRSRAARGAAQDGRARRRARSHAGEATTSRPPCARSGGVSRPPLRSCRSDQREALELAYYGGLTQSELAERLGVPLGTVKSRMFAALGKLRDLLETGPA